MAETDDPHEDLQVAAMTAGAAGARVAETVIRAKQNAQNNPGSPGVQPVANTAVTRDPEIVRARQVADAMNGRPASEAARSKPIAQPAQQVQRIRVREPERSR